MKMSLRHTVGLLSLMAGLGLVTLAWMPAAQAQAAKKAFAATGSGTIKGKVTLDGAAPGAGKLKIDPAHKDAGHCSKGDTEDLTWVVGPNKELANVVVFLKPPAGQYFKVDMDKKTWTDELTIDQPFCAFKPHVSVVFADYEGKPVQKLVVKNSAPILHNSRVSGSPLKNPAKGGAIPAGKQEEFVLKSDTTVIKINCDAHKWMEAFIWAFDHPYAAVTDADGNFEIKNAPTGAELQVMAWHEDNGTPANGMEIKKGALKDGDVIEFKIKKK
jgi:hypothetical protein